VNDSTKFNAADSEFRSKANELLDYFDNKFGVNDFFDLPDPE
jgi:hypothetical protein